MDIKWYLLLCAVACEFLGFLLLAFYFVLRLFF